MVKFVIGQCHFVIIWASFCN